MDKNELNRLAEKIKSKTATLQEKLSYLKEVNRMFMKVKIILQKVKDKSAIKKIKNNINSI